MPQTEAPTAAHIALCLLVMSAGWSVLLIAWPYLVELLPPRHQFTAERSWYALRVAVPALAGLAGLPFIERHRRRLPALAVSVACFSLAVIVAAIEVQRVDSQRGDMPMIEALKQSDKFVWYGAALAAFTSLGAGLTVHKRPLGPRRSRSNLHGTMDFLAMREAAKVLPETGGIVVGERYRVNKDDVAHLRFDPKNPHSWGRGGKAPLLTFDCSFGSTHGLVFAGSGGFKTVSVVVPTCLRWKGPLVCLDPTGEVTDMVYNVRSSDEREVFILDPRKPAIGFNVLGWIGTGHTSAEEDVATVVTWLRYCRRSQVAIQHGRDP